ncbi:tetratricopeptide repeat protein [Flavobacterium antarcticum]|uniref:tetratricopeptide repeat protein n=1 Tax=Flavobacterium antarcticum TaxID=271155 RepID=UPI0003B6E2C3|nr:tetratricopeptide repeat protein [Flavobacterium antarcticum]
MTYKNIVVVLAILFSLVVKGQEKDKNLPEGNEAFNEKNYADAETNYRISASKFPKKADSYYNLGNTIYTINQPAEAKFAYQNAIKNATTRAEKHKAFHNLGNVLMKEKNYEGAVNIYRQALINNPSDDETRYNYALAKKMLKENPPKDEKKNDKEKDEKKEQDKKEKEDKKDGDKDKKDNKGDKDKDKKDEGKNEKDDKGDGKKPKEGQISQQRIQNLLDAVNNDEKRVQEKVNAQKVKGKPVETDKDW